MQRSPEQPTFGVVHETPKLNGENGKNGWEKITRPVPVVSTVLSHFAERFGEPTRDEILYATERFSPAYLRWQVVRKKRLPGGSGFEGYFWGLYKTQEEMEDMLPKTLLLYTMSVLNDHVKDHPHDKRLSQLEQLLDGERMSDIQAVRLGYHFLHTMRRQMQHLVFDHHRLTPDKQQVRSIFHSETAELVRSAEPVKCETGSDGYMHTYELPQTRSQWTIAPEPENPISTPELLLYRIGLMGEPVMRVVEYIPNALFEPYTPYNPPKGTPKRELLDLWVGDIIASRIDNRSGLIGFWDEPILPSRGSID